MAERVPIWYELSAEGQRATVRDFSLRRLAQLAARLKTELGAAGIAVASVAPGTNEICCVASCGASAPPPGTRLDLHSGLSGQCMRENRTFFSNNVALDERVSAAACQSLGVRSFACVPLRQGTTCIGMLAVFSEMAGFFNSSVIERIEREAVHISEIIGPATSSRGKLAIVDGTMRESGDGQAGGNSRSDARKDESLRLHVAELAGSVREGHWKRIALIAVSVLLIVVIAAAATIKVQQRRFIARRDHANLPAPQPMAADDSSVTELMASAQAGSVAGQAELAQRYAEGNGVAPDKVMACVWYIIAGAKGDTSAKASAVALSHSLRANEIAQIRFNVGKLYVQGTAVPRDLVTAYSWFALAQAAGDVRAGTEQEKLEAIMNPQQVAEGLQRARDWMMAQRSKHERASQSVAANSAPSP